MFFLFLTIIFPDKSSGSIDAPKEDQSMFLDGMDESGSENRTASQKMPACPTRTSGSRWASRESRSNHGSKPWKKRGHRGVNGYHQPTENQQGCLPCYFEIELSPEHFRGGGKHTRENPIITQICRVTGRCRLHVHAVASSKRDGQSAGPGYRSAAGL